MTVVWTPYCGQVGISDMFVWGPSMLAVQPIAGMASGILPIAASAEGPSADSRTTFPKDPKQRRDSMGHPAHQKTMGGCAYEWV